MERINKVNIEIASIKQLNERDSLKNEIAELQNEVRSVKLLALDYDAQLKKLDAYLKESSQVVPRKTIFERIFRKKR